MISKNYGQFITKINQNHQNIILKKIHLLGKPQKSSFFSGPTTKIFIYFSPKFLWPLSRTFFLRVPLVQLNNKLVNMKTTHCLDHYVFDKKTQKNIYIYFFLINWFNLLVTEVVAGIGIGRLVNDIASCFTIDVSNDFSSSNIF